MAGYRYENNKMYRAFGLVADCFLLGAMWIFTSIPVFTVGAGSAALYYTVNKCVRQGRSYAWREYWGSFKGNFKKATLAWLIFLALGIVLFLDINLMKQALEQDSPLGALYYFFLVLSAVVMAWIFCLFPYMARFEGSLREVMKKSFIIMIANIGWSALLVAIFVACFFLCNDLQFLYFFFPGGFAFLQNLILERVFRKYMLPEDLERELEEGRKEFRR